MLGIIFFMSITLLQAADIKVQGDVFINGKKATSKMKVNLGDYIVTRKKSKIIFNIGEDAFMAKGKSEFSIDKSDGIKKINVVAGGVLGVFKKGSKYKLSTKNMTAGIRGTGVYLVSREDKSYFCTCYGETQVDVGGNKFPLKATHHHMIWIKENGTVEDAHTLEDHSDDDLRELEAFVGRIPAFDQH